MKKTTTTLVTVIAVIALAAYAFAFSPGWGRGYGGGPCYGGDETTLSQPNLTPEQQAQSKTFEPRRGFGPGKRGSGEFYGKGPDMWRGPAWQGGPCYYGGGPGMMRGNW